MCGIAVELLAGDVVAACASDSAAARRASLRSALRRRGPDSSSEHHVRTQHFELRLLGAVLRLRGASVVAQPLVDGAGNALLWNGEIFGGNAVIVPPGESDTRRLLEALATATSIPDVMQSLCGPWAFVYWHAASCTLWYGRDRLGRRSMLRIDESPPDATWRRLLLSSVAASDAANPAATSIAAAAIGDDPAAAAAPVWTELPADGIGSSRILAGGLVEQRWHAAPRPPPPPALASALVAPAGGDDAFWKAAEGAGQVASARLLQALSAAVRRRVCNVPPPRRPTADATSRNDEAALAPGEAARCRACVEGRARVAVLFSGGIDCMVLARLADLHLPPSEPLDLINVAFGDLASQAPDRISGRAGVEELRSLSARTFRLVRFARREQACSVRKGGGLRGHAAREPASAPPRHSLHAASHLPHHSPAKGGSRALRRSRSTFRCGRYRRVVTAC